MGRRVVGLAVAVEGGLAVGALLLAWTFGVPVWASVHGSLSGWLGGLLATVPMLAALWLSYRFPVGPVARLHRLVDELLLPLLRGCRVGDLLLISILAGLGEELFFRGFVQDGLRQWLGPWVGEARALWLALAVASLLFGLAHCLSVAYVVFATVLGLFLGWLYLATGDLVAPIVAHALYDFVALLVLVRRRDPTILDGAPPMDVAEQG